MLSPPSEGRVRKMVRIPIMGFASILNLTTAFDSMFMGSHLAQTPHENWCTAAS